MNGICTLANDVVYDQVIALINSIEVIMGKDFPICIYPYDNRVSQLTSAIAQYPQVQLYSDRDSMAKWDDLARRIWDMHPTAKQVWSQSGATEYHRFGTHRRFCAFDAPFDHFLYMDADTLLMDSVEGIFEQLKHHDCIVYDFQHKDPTHVYNVNSPQLNQVFAPERIEKEIFCSGFYASKRNLFDDNKLNWLLTQLKSGEAEILYPSAPDQTIINYLMMRSQVSIYNFALNLSQDQKTGCCVTSPHFTTKDQILYDHGKRLTYIHYIGIPSSLFTKVCNGENVDFPYRDLFLHYRYLRQPQQRPQLQGKAKPYQEKPSYISKILRKLGLKN